MNLPQIPNYEFLELIGEGSCGYVYRTRYRGTEERVVKVVKALAVNHGLFVACMKTVAGARPNPLLVDICGYEFGQNPGYYISSLHGRSVPTAEAPDGPDAWQPSTIEPLMGALPLDQAMRLVDQMAEGLAHLHRLEVPHIGLKPSNVFIDLQADGSRRVRIADWGEGFVTGVHYMELGDRGFYASPEQLSNGDFSQGKAKRWDVYAFGVVSYRLLTGVLPRLDPQFDEYLEARDQGEGTALAMGKVVDDPAAYVDWIHAQPDIIWPGPPPSQAEGARRRVIERCLAIDPAVRFADMREVIAEFREIENAALLRRMERDMSTRHQQAVDGLEEKVAAAEDETARRRRQLMKWRAIAAAIVVGAGLIGWGGFKLFQKEMGVAQDTISELRADARRQIAEERLRFDMALAEKDTVVATVERTVEARSEAADAAREVLLRSQQHGDRLFQVILENRDSDVPEFRQDRRQRLVEARNYYESVLEVYANHRDFYARSADAYRFLGEIYLELGEVPKAQRALGEAATRYEALPDGGEAGGDAGHAVLALAKVRQRQAELSARLKPAAAETLSAIDAAQQAWAKVGAAQPDAVGWQVIQAENRLMAASVKGAQGDKPAAMKVLEEAADVLVGIHEKHPQNDRAAAALGRAFASIGGLLAEVGEIEQAEALYDQSVVLFSDAITLNGAIDEYQLAMAESLSQLGRLRRDPQTLSDAVTVLSVAQERDPGNASVAAALAGCLGILAEMQRDGGETAAALDFERRAVSALEAALAGGGSATQPVRFQLAERLCHLAELLGDSEQFAESKKIIDAAIERLGGLLRESPDNADYQRLLARAQGLGAFASEKLGDAEAAKALYSAAMTQWQTLSRSHPEDPQASEGMAWAKRQLESLQ